MLRGFFLGFIKIHLLHHAAQDSVYGLQLLQELRRHGYDLSPGTLYPLLHELERSGYLARENRLVGGRVRKYYRATPLGERALQEARSKITELVDEVVRDKGRAQGTAHKGQGTRDRLPCPTSATTDD